MKKMIMALLCALLLIACVPALADVNLSQNQTLTDQALLGPIQQTEYANWDLYQPTSSEIVGQDMTRDQHFHDRQFFPVVAVKESRAVLILLHRSNGNWAIYGINSTALNRTGLTLYQFTIDSNNRPDDTGLPIYFGFSDSEHTYYDLSLTATDVYTTRFGSLHVGSMSGPSPKVAERLFADSFSIEFNSSLNFKYYYHDPYTELTYSMCALTGESEYDNFATFNLATAPLSLLDAMEECTAYSNSSLHEGKILLKQFNTGEAATLCEIPEGARLLREVDVTNFASRDWVLVAYGEILGYLPKSNIIQ